jgi:hypothetical protein
MPITLDGTLGITTPALTVTGASTYTGDISTAGNLVFTTTGDRIIGDMSNGTLSNRLAFQTSTINATTSLTVLPNGTSTTSQLNLEGDPASANGAAAQFINVGGSDVRIASSIRGSGTYLPFTIYTGGSERMRIDTSGNVGIGTTSPVDKLGVLGNIRTIHSGGNFYQLGADATGGFLYSNQATAFLFYTGGAERMRISSTGNVGIGTNNPVLGLLDINGASSTLTVRTPDTTSPTLALFVNAGSNGVGTISVDNGGIMTFDTGSTGAGQAERMRIDAVGNVGIGVTPSAWSTTNSTDALQISSRGSIWANVNSTSFNNNWYLASGDVDRYIATAPATRYVQDATGIHQWLYAPSGTAGATISFTEALRIGTSGQIGIAGANYGTSGQALVSNGSGSAPSWQNVGAAAGQVIQVVQTTNTSRSATACVNGGTDIPGMSVNITPSSASNKILVLINIAFNAPENENLVGMLLRNGTKINQNTSGPGVAGFFGIATANDGNYRMWASSGCFLDSPATTSAITYKLQGGGCNGTRTLYLNGTGRNSSTDATGASTITVMEIKG